MRDNNNLDNEPKNSAVSLRDGLTYLLIGTGIGAAVALLFAPKSGTELRSDIADVTRKGYDATLEKAQDLRVQSTDVIKTVREKADAVYDFAATKLAKGGEAVDGVVADSKTAISDGIDHLQNESNLANNSRTTARKSTSIM